MSALANLRHDGQSERVSTRLFDPEFGPGVRTVRHAPKVEADRRVVGLVGLTRTLPDLLARWDTFDDALRAEYAEQIVWHIRLGLEALGVAVDPPIPAPVLPAAVAHPAQMFSPFAAPALEPMPDEPEEIP